MKTYSLFLLFLISISGASLLGMQKKSLPRQMVVHNGTLLGYMHRIDKTSEIERYRVEDERKQCIAFCHVHKEHEVNRRYVWFKFLAMHQEPLSRMIVSRWKPTLRKQVKNFKTLTDFLQRVKKREEIARSFLLNQ